MTISTSRLAYEDAYKILERAINDRQGIRIHMKDADAATHFRMRLHMARKIDREDNALIYAKGEFMHGRSEYDRLTMKIRNEEGKIWLYLERNNVETLGIEDLTGEPPEELMAPEPRVALPKPVLQIESPLKIRRL